MQPRRRDSERTTKAHGHMDDYYYRGRCDLWGDDGRFVKLVRRGNEYGIRVGWWPFYRYVDLHSNEYFWTKNDRYFRDCFGDKERTTALFRKLSEKIVVVKDAK